MTANKLVCVVALVGGGCAVEDKAEQTDTVAQSATQASVWHQTWFGRDANVWYYDPSTASQGMIDAFENTTAGTRTAFLQFTRNWWSWEGGSFTVYSEYGWGPIAPSDLQISADARSASLNTTTGANFIDEICAWSPWTWTYNCMPGGSQTFALTWNQNGIYSTQSSGTRVETWGKYSTRWQGTYQASSADASGSAFGGTLPNMLGYISDSKNTTVSRDILK